MATTTNLELVITAKDHASATLRSISQQLSSTASSFPKFSSYFGKEMAVIGTAAKAAAVGIASIGAALTAVGVSAVKSASDYEQSRIAFETMLGSAEKAKSLLRDITKFAKTTPFELPGVVDGSKQLLAYGFAQEEIIPTMKKLGDISAGLNINLSDMAWLYGTTRVQGRLFAKDLYQFTNRGIPLTAELAKQFGVAENKVMELVEKGKVGFPDVEKAFASMTGQGGRFQDLMIKQSTTFGGVVSNLKDGFGIITRAIVGMNEEGDVREGSLFDKLRISASTFYSYLETNKDAITNFLSSKIDYAVQRIKEWYDSIGGAQGIKQALTDLWDKITNDILPVLASLVEAFMGTAKFIEENWDWIWKLIAAFEAVKLMFYAGGVLKAIGAFGSAIYGVTTLIAGKVGLSAALAALPFMVTITVALVGFALIMQQIKGINEAIESIDKSREDLDKTMSSLSNKLKTAEGEDKQKILKQIKAVEQGYKTIAEGQSSIANSLSITGMAKSLFGKALGGSVAQGTPYVVGEYRPEVFVPSQSGNIRQMSQMQKEVNINFNNVSVRSDQDINEIAYRVKKILNREQEMYQLGAL